MSRDRIMAASTKTPARRLRRIDRAKSVAIPPANNVVDIGEEADDFVLAILKSCPTQYSHFRAGRYLHVSDLVGKCIRKIALSERHKVTIAPSPLSDSQEITYAQGSCIGDYVVNRAIQGHSAKVWGKWQCLCGRTVAGPSVKPATAKQLQCPSCNTSTDRYKEYTVVDEEYLVVGNIDLIFQLPEHNALYITELKSIKKDAWGELIRPQPEHVLQAVFYWRIMREEGRRVVNKVSILYTCKEFMFKLPYKEFVINPLDHLHRLDDYLADAAARKKALDGGELPPRVMCPTEQSPEAKKCCMSQLCFAGK